MACRKTRGQTITEYSILLTIVAMAASMMFTAVKRGTQSLVKAGADQIGGQAMAEQDFGSDQGYLLGSRIKISDQGTTTKTYEDGAVTVNIQKTKTSLTRTSADAGFTEK